jgi:hypothetical protein
MPTLTYLEARDSNQRMHIAQRAKRGENDPHTESSLTDAR